MCEPFSTLYTCQLEKAVVCLPQMILMVNARERTGAKTVPVAGCTLDLSLLASQKHGHHFSQTLISWVHQSLFRRWLSLSASFFLCSDPRFPPKDD